MFYLCIYTECQIFLWINVHLFFVNPNPLTFGDMHLETHLMWILKQYIYHHKHLEEKATFAGFIEIIYIKS